MSGYKFVAKMVDIYIATPIYGIDIGRIHTLFAMSARLPKLNGTFAPVVVACAADTKNLWR